MNKQLLISNVGKSLSLGSLMLLSCLSFTKQGVAQSSCQDTVNSVINQIRAKGVPMVEYRVIKGKANEGYTGNPTNRSDILSIVMTPTTQRSWHIIENILYSDLLMNSWANSIVNLCGGTAVVYFGMNKTDWRSSFAIQADNTTKLRECIAPGEVNVNILSWNIEICV